MTKQFFFDFKENIDFDINSFFINHTNQDAFNLITNSSIFGNIFLVGPKKSGKTHLANIWQKNNDALFFENNLNQLISKNKNIILENIFNNIDEENIFHLINHCNNNSLKLLITSDINLFEYKFKLPDLLSRLKIFNYVSINNPDQEMLISVLTKLLLEKQFIIKNNQIFDYLLNRINRTYEDIYNLSIKMDKFSLEKKRQLTIPSIKKLI